MAIKNYTTTISPIKTAGEIEEILVNHGVNSIQKQIKDKKVTGLSFTIETPYGERLIALPVRTGNVLQILKENKQKNSNVKPTEEQAEKVAWRILKDWLDAQMALLEIEMVSLEEIFLPYIVIDAGGATVYEKLKQSNLLLPGGEI